MLGLAGEIRLQPFLEPVPLKLKRVLYKPGEIVDYVYFPGGGFVSVVTVLANGDMVEVATIGNEGIVGLSAVVLSLILGTIIALHCNNGQSRSRTLLQFIVFLPFLMPPMITGLSLLIFFREVDIPRSMLTIIIGHTVFVLALVYRTILVRLQGIGTSMVEASYDLGANAPQTFLYVLLPNLKSALIGAGVLAFALSFDETMITILVTGTQNTLPIRLWGMMRLGFTPDINALVAIILALTTGLVLVAARTLIPKEFAGAEG